MHDQYPMIVRRRQEWLPYPEEITFRLKSKRNARPDARVGEKAMPVHVRQREVLHP